jgi:DNA-binding response OmpR family regulator
LEHRGHTAEEALSADAAFRKFVSGKFDCIVTDLHLGSQSGLDLIRRIRAVDERVGIVIMSGKPEDLKDLPESLGVWNVLEKPFSGKLLDENIRGASELANITPEVEAEISRSCETTVHKMKDMQRDLSNETGIFRALKEK